MVTLISLPENDGERSKITVEIVETVRHASCPTRRQARAQVALFHFLQIFGHEHCTISPSYLL